MSLNIQKNYWHDVFLEILDYPDSDTTNKINSFSPEYFLTIVMISTEFMMEEFEFVGAEDYKFQNSAKWKKVGLLGNFELSKKWCKDNKSTILLWKSFKNRVSSKPTRFEETKFVLMFFLASFRLSGYWRKTEEQWFFSWIFLNRCSVFHWHFDEGNRLGAGWEIKDWTTGGINLISTF